LAAEYLVSIVVVSWNTRELLRACLASTAIACQELGVPVEVLVVDNASSDGSAEMVRDEFPEVRIVANTSNVGFAAATNQGIRMSKGSFILLLNPDTKTAKSFLGILLSFLESQPGVGAAGPRLLGRGGDLQVSCFPLPTLSSELWRLLHFDRFCKLSNYPVGEWGPEIARNVEAIQGACMLIRRAVLDQVGYLDESFFIYSEEIDLCRRMQAFGWKICWVPQAVVVHYGGESTKQIRPRMFLELYQSKIRYFRKHLGFWGAFAYKLVLVVAALPRLLLPPLLLAFKSSRREELRQLARNYYSLLVRLPAL
jgi:hypothetical protein